VSPPAKEPPHAVGLLIAVASANVALGTSFVPYVLKVMSDSSRVPLIAPPIPTTAPPAVTWRSTNPLILSVHPYTAYAVALGPGQASLRAEAEGLVAVAPITVLNPTSIGSNALVIESFAVIEYQYSSGSDWFYAPQIRAHAASGRTAVALTMQFTLPGLIYPFVFPCGAKLTEAPRELNGEVYGDWAFELGPMQKLTGDSATALVTFVDDAGAMSTRTVRGPIVHGGGPGTYGGDPGACFHGYGATG
jgi:hypothetical protein